MKILLISLFTISSIVLFSQTPYVTINIGGVVNSDSLMKPILGVISGPDGVDTTINPNLTTYLQDIGVLSIRNNDYYDDRLDMDEMFNCGGVTYPSWGTCSPTNINNYNFTKSDAQWQLLIDGGFEPFLRLGSSWPPSSGPFVKDFIGPQNATEEANWIIAADTVVSHYDNFPNGNSGLKYLNIWTEWPNQFSFWTTGDSTFQNFYTNALTQLQNSYPTKKIGGPGFTSIHMNKGIPSSSNKPYQLFIHLYNNNVKPDFLGFHVFSNNPMAFYNASLQYNDMLLAQNDFDSAPWSGTGFFDSTELIIDAWSMQDHDTDEYGSNTGSYNSAEKDKYLAKKEGATAFLAAWSVLQRANVERGYYYRCGDPGLSNPSSLANQKGIFYGDGSYKRHAYAFKMCSRLYNNYNKILSTSLVNVSNEGDSLWCLSGISSNGDKALLIANPNSKDIDVNLTIDNIAIVPSHYSSIEYYTIDDNNDGTISSTWNTSGTNTIFSHTGVLIILKPYVSTGIDVQIACDSYTWINGLTYFSSNNVAVDTLVNYLGNDSIVTLNLTINTIDSSVTQNGITLSADLAGAAYQWLNCDNSFSIITGETNQSFTASVNGNYAVEITINGCVDTSACFTVNTVGIVENDFGNSLLIYPNPTNGNFIIDLGLNYESIAVRITDVNGKLIQSNSYNNSQLMELKLKEPAGVYLLVIESGDKKAAIRLIKE